MISGSFLSFFLFLIFLVFWLLSADLHAMATGMILSSLGRRDFAVFPLFHSLYAGVIGVS